MTDWMEFLHRTEGGLLAGYAFVGFLGLVVLYRLFQLWQNRAAVWAIMKGLGLILGGLASIALLFVGLWSISITAWVVICAWLYYGAKQDRQQQTLEEISERLRRAEERQTGNPMGNWTALD